MRIAFYSAMVEDLIPPDVRCFILERIESVAELEALLLLHKHERESWSAARVADRLYVTEPAATDILARLTAERLCTLDGGLYRFAPATPNEAGLVRQLADAYARHLIPVTRIVHSKPARIQRFADAFRFRSGKEET
jgi:hypothetical protein